MAETGVLRPDARVELLDGRIIDMSPIGPFHGEVTTYLDRVIRGCLQGPVADKDPKLLASRRTFRAAARFDAGSNQLPNLTANAIRGRRRFFS